MYEQQLKLVLTFGNALLVRRERLNIPQWRIAEILKMMEPNVAKIELREESIANEEPMENWLHYFVAAYPTYAEGLYP